MFERDVPGANTAGLSGQAISKLPIETCQTMNGMWGYKIIDQTYKSDTTLIRLIVQTAGRNANLLLNIGPEATGALPATAIDRLEKIGKWMKTYGKTVKDGVREASFLRRMGGIDPEGQDRLPTYPRLEEPYALTALDREGEERGSLRYPSPHPLPADEARADALLRQGSIRSQCY